MWRVQELMLISNEKKIPPGGRVESCACGVLKYDIYISE
jgi:hypothetical protein